MSASSLSAATGDTGLDADSQFNIMLLYADLETGRRGKEIHDRLAKQFAHDFNLALSLWRVDVLEDAELRALAAKEAMDANLLIVSAHTSADLPPSVVGWVKTILEQKKDSPTALVALLDRDDARPLNSSDSVYALLRDAARRPKLGYFFQ